MCAGVESGQPLYGAGYKNGEGVCLAVRELIGVGEEVTAVYSLFSEIRGETQTIITRR